MRRLSRAKPQTEVRADRQQKLLAFEAKSENQLMLHEPLGIVLKWCTMSASLFKLTAADAAQAETDMAEWEGDLQVTPSEH